MSLLVRNVTCSYPEVQSRGWKQLRCSRKDLIATPDNDQEESMLLGRVSLRTPNVTDFIATIINTIVSTLLK